MFDRDRKISAWQTGILLFILLFANKILVLPSIIATKSKLEAILIVMSLFACEIGLLLLFWWTKNRNPNKSFFDVLKAKCGSPVCKTIACLVCLYFLSKSVLLYNVCHAFLQNLVYKDVSDILFLVAILPVVNFLAFSGITPHARTMQLFFPSIFLLVVNF